MTEPDIDKALDSSDYFIKQSAIRDAGCTPANIDKALDDNIPPKNANISPNYFRNISILAIERQNASPANINKALNSTHPHVREKAASHQNANEDNINKALNDASGMVKLNAISNPNATPANIDKALDSNMFFVRYESIKHPNANEANFLKAWNQNHNNEVGSISEAQKTANTDMKLRILNHPRVTSAIIELALADDDLYIRLLAMRHPNATKEQKERASDDPELISYLLKK